MTELTGNEREELMRRSWMATDGLWFYETALSLGLDGANENNIKVVREFARQEMLRLLRSLGVEKVDSVEKYHEVFRYAMGLYLGSLFQADEEIADDVHQINVTTCFAYKGVKRAGIDKEYHCGPGERLTGWLQGMGMNATIEPGVDLCQMAHTGSCSYQVKLGMPDG